MKEIEREKEKKEEFIYILIGQHHVGFKASFFKKLQQLNPDVSTVCCEPMFESHCTTYTTLILIFGVESLKPRKRKEREVLLAKKVD